MLPILPMGKDRRFPLSSWPLVTIFFTYMQTHKADFLKFGWPPILGFDVLMLFDVSPSRSCGYSLLPMGALTSSLTKGPYGKKGADILSPCHVVVARRANFFDTLVTDYP